MHREILRSYLISLSGSHLAQVGLCPSQCINMSNTTLEYIPTLSQRYNDGDLKPATTTRYPVDKALLDKISL